MHIDPADTLPELDEFYAELLTWAEAGFPVHPIFKVDKTICFMLAKYKDCGWEESIDNAGFEFRKAGFHGVYPFAVNEGQGVWLNQTRREWTHLRGMIARERLDAN